MSLPSQWDLKGDEKLLGEHALMVARCTKIMKQKNEEGKEESQYMITIKQMAKYVVALGQKLAPTDVEEGMRVGVDK